MWHSVGFLFFLLFVSCSEHDVKKFQFVEDDLHNTSAQYYGQVSSCYRKVNPDKCNSLTVRSEVKKFRQILPTDSNRATSGGLPSSSISCSGSRNFSSSINLDSDKLVSSVKASSSVVESPFIFSGKSPFKRHNRPFSSLFVHIPHRYLFSVPSLPVEPSRKLHTPNHIFPRPALDHMPPFRTPKFSSPVFLPKVTSKSHMSHMSPPTTHNIPPFVSPVRSSPQEPVDIRAPYSFIPPNSLTIERMRLVQAPPFPYDSVSSGPSLPPQQNSQSHERKHPGRDIHALPPSLVPTHHRQHQDQSPSGSYENRPFVRIFPPSSSLPLITHSPVVSDGKQAQGPSMIKIEPPKGVPPLFLSSWPSTLETPLVSPQNNQHQMHQTAFHPVMSNPENPSTKWLSPSFFAAPSQVRPPVVHSWTSVTPSGLVSFPPTTSSSERTVRNINMPVKAPSVIFPSSSHNQGPVASAPSIFTLRKPQNEPSMPVTALPRNRSNRRAPVATPPKYFSSPLIFSPSKSPMEKPKASKVAPFAKFPPPLNQHDLKEPAVSPIIFPSEPPWKNSRIPVIAPVQKRASRHAPTSGSVSSPQISFPLEPPLGNVESPAFVPSLKGTGYPPPTNLPSEPQEAPPPIISPFHGHHQNVQGPVTSSPVAPFKPPLKNPSVPHLELPRNRSKRQPPVTLAPKYQEHVTAPMSIPSEPHTAYPVTPKMAPSITFRYSPYQQGLQGPSNSPSNPSQKNPRMPVANQPRKRSWRYAPVTTVPVTQGPVSLPPIAPPPEQPIGNSTTTFAPSITSLSPSHYSGVKGHVISPSSESYGPPAKKPSIFLAPSPMISSHWHSPTGISPIRQGPTASPLIIASQPPQKMQRVIQAPPPNKRPWRHAPLAIPPVHQGSVPSQFSVPSGPPKFNLRAPAFAPQMMFPTPHHHWLLKGPDTSPPSMIPSEAPQRKLGTPLAAPPSKRSWKHAPVTSPPIGQGAGYPPPTNLPSEPQEAPPPFISPSHGHHQNVQSPVASSPVAPFKPPLKIPSVPPLELPRSRSKRQPPVTLAPKNQEHVTAPISIPSESHTEYPVTPKMAPSITFRFSPYQQGLQGPSNSPSDPSQKEPRMPVANQPRKRSWRCAPVTTVPVTQGPVSFPLIAPPPEQPIGNSRTTFAPSITIPSPSHYSGVKGHAISPSSDNYGPPLKKPSILLAPSPMIRSHWHSPTGIPPIRQASPLIIASQPPQKMQRVIRAPPPIKRPWKHAPLEIPPVHQGSVPSQFTIPSGPPKVNSGAPAFAPRMMFPTPHHHWVLKGPDTSPSSMIPSQAPQRNPSTPLAAPPSKRSWKHAPATIPPLVQGPVSSPVKSQHQNVRAPTVSPSIRLPSPPHHRSWMHAPVGSLPNIQGPIRSPVKSPYPSPSGNLRSPTVSPSIIYPFPRHNRSQKHAPVGRPPMIQGPIYSPEKSPHPLPAGNLRTPAVSPSIIFPSPPHHRSWKHAPVASPPMRPVYSPVKSPHPSSSGNLHAPVASPPMSKGPVYSPVKSPHPSPSGNLSIPAASPLNIFPFPPHHGHGKGSHASPNISPSEPPEKTPTTPVAAPPMIFPPPPPGQDCSLISCTVPYTSTPPGSPCGCVYPMQIEIGLGVALYAFFPLVSELASEIAAGTFLKQSQVRIMGANAYSQDQEKTIVDIDLVPLGENFDNTTAFLIFERFWQKKVMINETLFGDYWVIYIQYHGLPPSPPSAFSNATENGVPDSSSNGPSKGNPLGVDVNKQSDKMGAGTIAVVALSSAIAVIICLGTVWIILLKCRNQNRPSSAVVEPTLVSSITKRSGGGSILSGSMASSTSMSLASSMATYTGSAKTFTSAELERATDRFNTQNILGEGGFGRVYRGVLEDGTKVAVKVLTRDDQQGGREFIAEVEMLSRLHHRNLVKLIGICTEEHNRCLVYELIPNGSVESHLHGVDKENAPLDWDARIKIALGAARGLAYLHEDSSPRVIHRDFKASNILLEDDFTPKVSDFGLAKSASEEVSGYISTRVMGTFGYVAPEYAMTGHLLVKSDVYSYGVVLLELLSGRKPVDMSQPPGQENLVTWARPLLTSKEGLETLVDPALGSNLPFDNIARVAAIASMCVQPDHSHRPFMGEVVQALKLVYNDSDASNAGGSGSFSRGESSNHDTEVKDSSSQPWRHSMQYIPDSTSFVTIDYDSGPLETQGLEVERPLSASALMSTSGRFIRQLSGSFRRYSSSGPLRTNKTKESWYGIRGLEGGSISEHGVKRHFGRGSDGHVHELWP